MGWGLLLQKFASRNLAGGPRLSPELASPSEGNHVFDK
jgi:hypothetical protein